MATYSSLPDESALVALVPEAESLVGAIRRRYGFSTDGDFPPHVTILYPFKPPGQLTAGVISALRDLILKQPSFTVSFSEVCHFPDTLYLTPVPAQPFIELTERVVRYFPENLPYGGEFSEVIPHLTIAQIDDPRRLAEIAAHFDMAYAAGLPIRAVVDAVTLMENSSGSWRVLVQFPLGQKP